jgi:hypothetical protein
MKKLPVLCICIFLLIPHVLGAECFRPDLGAFLMNSQPVINSEDSSHFPSLEGVWLEMNTGVKVLQGNKGDGSL